MTVEQKDETGVVEVAVQKKLTKAQKEFFGAFASNAVENILGPVLEFKGLEITAEQVSTLDLSELVASIGGAFLERVDFKTLKAVDKFMRSEDFVNVVLASTEVNAMVQGLLVQIIAPLIPVDSEREVEEQDE